VRRKVVRTRTGIGSMLNLYILHGSLVAGAHEVLTPTRNDTAKLYWTDGQEVIQTGWSGHACITSSGNFKIGVTPFWF
jgi:hypothetical protein